MKKILVHLHLFYIDQANFFIDKLKNIDVPYDLFITYIEENSEIKNMFLTLNPNVKFLQVENRGYDVYPFIRIIQSVNLDDYDFILKLHTKNKRDKKLSINELKIFGYSWRNQLVNCLIGSNKQFKKNLKRFKNPKIGMIYNKLFDWKLLGNKEDKEMLVKEIESLKFKKKCTHFCAGTMFLARADIFKFLQERKFNREDFPTYCETASGNTLAHVYERVFTLATEEFGYRTDLVYSKTVFNLYFRRFYKRLFSVGNLPDKSGIKRKYIFLLGLKIPMPS